MQRDRQLRLARLTTVALAAGPARALAGGLVMGLVWYWLLFSAIYTHASTHPGCGEMGITPTGVGIEDAQDVTYPVIGQTSSRPLLLIYGEHEAESGHAREQYEADRIFSTRWGKTSEVYRFVSSRKLLVVFATGHFLQNDQIVSAD